MWGFAVSQGDGLLMSLMMAAHLKVASDKYVFFVRPMENSHVCARLWVCGSSSFLKFVKKVGRCFVFRAAGYLPECPSKALWKAVFGNIRYLINEGRVCHIFVQLTSIILAAANYALLICGGP